MVARDLGLYGLAMLFFAALAALVGTNAQARFARQRLREHPDREIAAAGLLWRPMRLGRRYRRRRTAAEAPFRADPGRWREYRRVCDDLAAWNWLETAVALALLGSVAAFVAAVLPQ